MRNKCSELLKRRRFGKELVLDDAFQDRQPSESVNVFKLEAIIAALIKVLSMFCLARLPLSEGRGVFECVQPLNMGLMKSFFRDLSITSTERGHIRGLRHGGDFASG
jgi:hypothetical protein